MKTSLSIQFIVSLLIAVCFSQAMSAQSITAAGYTFTASPKTFTYLSGGTGIPAIETDDNYTTIPIGFTFTFCGVDYTDVTVCSNGWLRFGTGAGSSSPNWNYNDQVNSGIQPCVYALYEDINGDVGTSSYLVTGTSPNRVFTWECRDWLWDYAAANPSVSFQVKLYEATGVIECLYKQELGAVELNTSGGATIGIAKNGSDWQVLNNTSAAPISSSVNYVYNLSAVPTTGQSYAWDPGPPCTQPSSLSIVNVNSVGVTFSWASIAGTAGYEYAVDQNTTAPSTGTNTSANSATVTGLLPATTYYIHVRNHCSVNNISKWTTLSFQTLPACVIPTNVIASNIDSVSADVSWSNVSSATTYQYVLDTSSTNPPANTSSAVSIMANGNHFGSLISGTTYYIHVRSLCPGSDSSEWIMAQFYVPIPCRRPDILVSDLKSDKAVVYWPTINTAYEYEYVLDQSSSSVTVGTPTPYSYVQTVYLKSNTLYYFHARSLCTDHSVKTVSPWSAISFQTPFATGITDADNSSEVMKVFPNPVKDMLYLQLNKTADDAMVFITDIMGRKLITQKVTGNNMSINTARLPHGIYYVKYIDAHQAQTISVNKD